MLYGLRNALRMGMKSVIFSVVFSAFTFAATTGSGSAKLYGDFSAASKSNQSVNVIIHFTTAPNAKLHLLVSHHGGQLLRQLALIDSAAYRIPAANLARLAARPEVAGISLDRQVKATMDITAATVNAPTAWNTY